jgi:ADP-ribose pyrophosphatase YjhB (NUDIX family)
MKYGTMSYLECDKGILMIRKNARGDDPNSRYCTLPGGKLESNEKGANPVGRLESAIRETQDESGITLIEPVLRGTILFDNRDRTFSDWTNPTSFLVYIFSAASYHGDLRPSDEGTPFWASWEEIEGFPKNPGDKYMYQWLKDGRPFFGVIKHKGNEIDFEGTWVDFLQE